MSFPKQAIVITSGLMYVAGCFSADEYLTHKTMKKLTHELKIGNFETPKLTARFILDEHYKYRIIFGSLTWPIWVLPVGVFEFFDTSDS